jgi:hypothetical protein
MAMKKTTSKPPKASGTSAGKSNPKAAAKGKGSLPKSGLSQFEPKSPYTNPTKVKARAEYKKTAENRKKNSIGK